MPIIAIVDGYCFAGNAALTGCADVLIATERSNLGMAGPAMIEGGGLGRVAPTEIGPIDVHRCNGVVGVVPENRRQGYDVRAILEGLFDAASLLGSNATPRLGW